MASRKDGGPARRAPGACSVEELRSLFLFEALSPERLEWLCRRGRVEQVMTGPVFVEGQPAACLYVLLDGEIELTRRVGGEDLQVAKTAQRGVYAGAVRAYLGAGAPQVYVNSMDVTQPARFFVLDAVDFGALMRDWFPMALHLLEGLFSGISAAQQMAAARERLLALGTLSAGLTHELNNPAAAAVRATATLRERVAGMRHKLGLVAAGPWDRGALESLIGLQEDVAERVAKAPALGPIETADAEDAVGDWLDAHGVAAGWELAPTFVQAGLDTAWLDLVADTVADPSVLEGAVRWLNYTIETELLMNEIQDSTQRISALVAAAKQYSQLDRAPYRTVDVRELLDSTLVMLGAKFGAGVAVVKEYDASLPEIPAYPAELNQVWTNLIDNAVHAMGGVGTLTVRIRRDGPEHLVVEIADTGPGVDPGIRSRIFEPFFTTKPVGEGTGLGLDISWRIVVNKHHGDLQVQSQPGQTVFRVRLPLQAPARPPTERSDEQSEEPG
jgi:signal transduction histidine kinase